MLIIIVKEELPIMDYIEQLKILFLGIVEGITEWLPISSTGHMLLVDALFTLQLREEFKKMFFVVIQLGAIIAVLVYFWKELFPFHLEKKEKIKLNADMGTLSLWGKVLVACLPAAVLGLLFDDILEEYLHTPLIIALMLILYGVAFILIEKRNATRIFPTQSLEEISYTQALLIGAFQVLSLIPGTSRSGATILGALLLGITRPVGAKFSFFLAIPGMFGASGLKLLKFLLDGGGFIGWEFFYLLFGAVVAFVISMLTIKLLMRFVEKHDFKVFGWYRIVLGAIVICALVIPTLLG